MSKLSRDYSSLDPLGSVRKEAEMLWKKDGSPSDRTWEDYFEHAEKLLLKGHSKGQSSERKRSVPQDTEKAKEVEKCQAESRSPITRALARNIDDLLDEHEALCLSWLLLEHQIEFINGQSFGPLDPEEIAKIISELCHDCDPCFLKAQGTASYSELKPELRNSYWQAQIKNLIDLDAPRSLSDRNTMARFSTLLQNDPEVKEVRLLATTSPTIE